MIATRRATFRLYPNKSQEAKLHYWRRLHKDLYNACLYQKKTEYKRFGRSISYYDQLSIAPSQTCPNCGDKKKKELVVRVHNCSNCNFVADRDVAAAMVMINYARGMERASTNVDAKPLSKDTQHCGGFRQVQQLKRQKPQT